MQFKTILLTLLAMLAPQPGAAQGREAKRPDLEIMNYRLSMEKLRKLVPAQRALNALAARDPAFFEKIDRETKPAWKTGRFTVAQRAAILDKYPSFKRALAGAGTTSREWLLTSEAMGNAVIAIEVKKGTLTSNTPPLTAAQKANVALLEENDDEFEKLMEELSELTDEMASQ